jgi:hypothetical protein
MQPTPTRPFPRPLSDAEREALLGPIGAERLASSADPDALRVSAAFARRIVRMETPALAHAGTRFLLVHERARSLFEALLGDLAKAGLAQKIGSIAGAYVPRYQRGSQRISSHAYGIAIDFDAQANMPGTAGTDLARDLGEFAERRGFAWGGRFKDPMHIELGRGQLG